MSWDDEAAGWNDNPAVVAYSRAAFRALGDLCMQHPVSLSEARILDFGCGTGLLTEAMAARGAQVVGLDVSPKMIAVLQAKIDGGLQGVTAVAGLLGDARGDLGGPFDLITCSSVCAFLDDYPATISTLAGLLSAGGLLVQWDWELDPSADEPFGLSRSQIQDALSAAGLSEVTVGVGFTEPFEGMTMAPLQGSGRRLQGAML